jgi:hypothetical protein
MALMAQGCNDTDFAANTFSQGNSDRNPGDPPTVCDPFGGGGGTNASNGIEAQLTYLANDSATVAQGGLSTASFDPNGAEVQLSPAKIILSQLNVATRPFTDGFTVKESGDKLQNLNGEALIEYFSVRANSSLRLTASDAEGKYELALLSDDGSILDLDPTGEGKNFERWINNDGTHANRVGCATKALTMKKGADYPIKMHYYQGPRVRIALMLLWRKQGATPTAELECGAPRNDSYFFTPGANSSSVPTAKYNEMLARGWKPVAPANFFLPDGQTNPCANK